jgi:hypothetical protein
MLTNQNFIELEQTERRTKTCISKSSIVFIESNGSECRITLNRNDQNGKQIIITARHTYDEIVKLL